MPAAMAYDSRQLASPDASTAAILGASSAGWSPIRTARRPPPEAFSFSGSTSSYSSSPQRSTSSSSSSSSSAMTPNTNTTATDGEASPSKIPVPEARAKLSSLRQHGLVSNSIFKSPTRPSPSQSNSNGSPIGHSASRRNFQEGSSPSHGGASGARAMGVGLGISVNSSPQAKTTSMPKSSSASSMGSQYDDEDSDGENSQAYANGHGSPRKSKGIDALQRAKGVSNSPFRRQQTGAAAGGEANGGSPSRPLELPKNAWAFSAQAASKTPTSSNAAGNTSPSSVYSHASSSPNRASTPTRELDARQSQPRTPERTPKRLATAANGGDVDSLSMTPKGHRPSPGREYSDSPSSRGLLVSNRLHGPRQMDNSKDESTPEDSPSKRERRKTVTFDEVLDVQEFDRESSVDLESLRSEGSNLSSNHEDTAGGSGGGSYESEEWSDEEIMWRREDRGNRLVAEKLVVVNGSPATDSSASPALSTPSLLPEGHGEDAQQHHLHQQQHERHRQHMMPSDSSSNDSRDVSSVDEPASPRQEEVDKTFNTAYDVDKTFNTAYEASFSHVDDDMEEGDDKDASATDISGYGALHRVESMVDEMLNDSILGPNRAGQFYGEQGLEREASPPRRRRNNSTFKEHKAEAQAAVAAAAAAAAAAAEDQSSNQAQKRSPSKPLPAPPQRQQSEHVARPPLSYDDLAELQRAKDEVDSAAGKLSLPAWSPLFNNENELEREDSEEVNAVLASLNATPTMETGAPTTTAAAPAAAAAATTTKPSGRPHISRDTILQRVAREKEQQAARSANGTPESVPQSQRDQQSHSSMAQTRSQNAMGSSNNRPRGSEPERALRSASGDMVSAAARARPSAPAPRVGVRAEEVPRAAPPPSPVRELAQDDLESPLERLGAEVAAEQAQHTSSTSSTSKQSSSRTTAPVGTEEVEARERQQQWFGSGSHEASVDTSDVLQQDESSRQTSVQPQPARKTALEPGLTPAQQADAIIARRRSKNGKGPQQRSRSRRSLSTGDASSISTEEEDKQRQRSISPGIASPNLAAAPLTPKERSDAVDDQQGENFEFGLEREISRICRQGDQKYRINDRGVFTGVEEKVSHTKVAGDVDSGKAWRRLRRPSDMNEYAKEMREYRANENPKKAAGKVFVLVDSFTPSSLPIPTSRPTRFYCVLDNGLHVVKTASAPLRSGSGAASKIGQEFELIQHRNLEFNLTLVVQRDAHLIEPHSREQSSPTGSSKRDRLTPSFSKGMGKLFSSPKKKGFGSSTSTTSSASVVASSSYSMREPMLDYVNREGAFGRAEVVFEQVAAQCLAKCLVVDLPVHGVSDPAPSLSSNSAGMRASADFSRNLSRVRGTLRLKLFYLPAMPSIPKTLLPENLGECIRGMENARWHSGAPWMEGVLTQLGGDCRSWRRRPVKAQGAHLIGFNEITKKPTIKIDLSQAIAVEEAWDPVKQVPVKMQMRSDEELDESYHVERSFRVTFADGERIHFFADTDEEMMRWVEALRKLVGIEVPPNAAWAQLAMEMAKTVAHKSAARLSLRPGGAPTTPSTSRMLNDADETPKQQQQRPSMPRPSHARSQSHALATVTEANTPPPSASQTPSQPSSAAVAPPPFRKAHSQETRRVPVPAVERPVSVYVDRH